MPPTHRSDMLVTMERLHHKSMTVLKMTDEGTVAAKIAELMVKDHDGDVTEPGFFGEQRTRMVWSHNPDVWIGKGRITEDGDAGVFEGEFFMDTQAGSEAFKSVKAMGDLAEWSYGFRLRKDGYRLGQHNGESVRFLTPSKTGQPGADVYEVSPVLQGAGIRTATLAMKAWTPGDPIPTDTTLTEEITAALKQVDELAQSVIALHTHLTEEGHTLSEAKATVIADLLDGLKQASESVAPILAPAEEPPADDVVNDLEAVHQHMQHLLRTV